MLDFNNFTRRHFSPEEMKRYAAVQAATEAQFEAERLEDEARQGNGHDRFGGDPEPTDNKLSPNRIDINRHLGTLFPPEFVQDYPDAWIEIAYADLGGNGKPNASEHFSAFDIAGAAEFAIKKNAAGFNIYVGVALRQGQTGPNSNGRSSEANFLASLHVWCDFDGSGDCARISNILEEKQLQTAMFVMTGRTPHERGHPYFRLAGTPPGIR
jgi:hypothetical protein